MAILRPTGPIHPDMILLDDPGRAMIVAQELIEGPLMGNHSFGLWGYHGPCPAIGRDLSVHSCGFGAASLAEVTIQLAQLGTRRVVRIAAWWDLQDRKGTELDDPAQPLGILAAVGAEAISAELIDPSNAEAEVFGLPIVEPRGAVGERLREQTGAARALPAVSTSSLLREGEAHGPAPEAIAAAEAAAASGLALDIYARDDATATLYALAPGLGLSAAAILLGAGGDEERPGTDGPLRTAALIAADLLGPTPD